MIQIRPHQPVAEKILCAAISSALVFFAMTGCDSPSETATAPTPSSDRVPTGGAQISADPNPVPAGEGLGNTRISWETKDGSTAQLFVSVNGGEEKLMGQGSKESLNAPWIQPGSTVFALYDLNDRNKLLASVTVTRPPAPSPATTRSDVPAPANSPSANSPSPGR